MSAGLIVFLVITGFLVVGLIGYFITIYNGLVRLRRNLKRNWSNIDVLLKQRHDELPKLVSVCEGYMKYERETLEKITSLRSTYLGARTVGEKSRVEGELAGALKTLFAVVEKYPDLKADQRFAQLQERISFLENQIADRRELYNESVNIYNIRINQIPDKFVASSCNFTVEELLKVAEAERKDVKIQFNFPK
ncbi:MAG: LemA family protein [bacterium (Candidatus Ratteibacteria) CG_4_9_14_3_um_filter_41_21]|uniref:LemA family protein n=1 Tax=bacterium (Candidatus Ratteibacteria) CG_4_9_14_3_um_filter_41_21 TaxID=2014289 RepID=A0A2M7YFG0_9BACT|nr:MAG: LemA family protein [Candidatus Omnitrophica bacterium CG1_02_41_171]PIW74192.1 MAG: LemA family protein [bacterium (Candidatus Ratteibacteria) CG_4_8_14_3_um_filter_41_36]PJA61699.1 MAG: LemA family protein [bacterium (Candidatus Ratteibacteria) CG_4_9_14_3_um_filter_41_21]